MHSSGRGEKEIHRMADLAFVALTIGLFALLALLARGVERL
jgi:hypothetical protein